MTRSQFRNISQAVLIYFVSQLCVSIVFPVLNLKVSVWVSILAYFLFYQGVLWYRGFRYGKQYFETKDIDVDERFEQVRNKAGAITLLILFCLSSTAVILSDFISFNQELVRGVWFLTVGIMMVYICTYVIVNRYF